VRQKLDAWLRDGGTIRIVPVGAFAVAMLLGIIPMWLEFGTFPGWAPRDKVGGPLLAGWVVLFCVTEVARRYWGRRGAKRWEEQLKLFELDRADQLAGAIDRICASLVPQGNGQLAPDHIQASLLQGIVDTVRAMASIDPTITLHASLLVPEMRREGRRNVRYLAITSTNRLAERRGWASFKADSNGPAQDSYGDGRFRVVPDTEEAGVRNLFAGRAYRSIVTLPVSLRCMGSKRLAVVSIDASGPGIFTEELVRLRLEPVTAPHLKLIAQSLILGQRNL
jgi:hypothetical protein